MTVLQRSLILAAFAKLVKVLVIKKTAQNLVDKSWFGAYTLDEKAAKQDIRNLGVMNVSFQSLRIVKTALRWKS